MSDLTTLLDDGRFVIVFASEGKNARSSGSGWLIDTSKSKTGNRQEGECISSFGMVNGIWCAVLMDKAGGKMEVIAKGAERNDCIVSLWHWKRLNYMAIPAKPWRGSKASNEGSEGDPA